MGEISFHKAYSLLNHAFALVEGVSVGKREVSLDGVGIGCVLHCVLLL